MLGLAFILAAFGYLIGPGVTEAFTFSGGSLIPRHLDGLSLATQERGDSVALNALPKALKINRKRGISPTYTNRDRERMAQFRQEQREAKRKLLGAPEEEPYVKSFEELDPIEDIYTRTFTGNATSDPIGGRKKYTLWIMVKAGPMMKGTDAIKEFILDWLNFLKFQMSCKNAEGRSMLSPIDGSKEVNLEYPMREYGIKPRGQLKGKTIYTKAKMVELKFQAPPSAMYYIDQKIHEDNRVLKYLAVTHFRGWCHRGEDNEMML